MKISKTGWYQTLERMSTRKAINEVADKAVNALYASRETTREPGGFKTELFVRVTVEVIAEKKATRKRGRR